MADIAVTAANVIGTASANGAVGIAGEAIVQGQALYLKASDSKLWKAINTATASAVVVGVALNCASAGQPVKYQSSGDITIGGTVVVGETYLLSDTAGGIGPVADILTTQKVSLIGFGKSATVLTIALNNTGIAHV